MNHYSIKGTFFTEDAVITSNRQTFFFPETESDWKLLRNWGYLDTFNQKVVSKDAPLHFAANLSNYSMKWNFRIATTMTSS